MPHDASRHLLTPIVAPCRLIVPTRPADGRGKWRLDEDAAGIGLPRAGELVLRLLCAGSKSTLSLGILYSRTEPEPTALRQPSRDCAVVRRQTGGGRAISHDRELTYSLVAAGHAGHIPWLVDSMRALSPVVHQATDPSGACKPARVGNDFKVGSGHRRTPNGEQSEPFLCFPASAPGRLLILVRGMKMCGSAQRRRRCRRRLAARQLAGDSQSAARSGASRVILPTCAASRSDLELKSASA